MNLNDVTEVWRSQDLSPLYGVDKTLLHQMLLHERAKHKRRLRRLRWFTYLINSFLFLTAGLFLAIMIDPKDDDVLIVWDYVVGAVGVAASMALAWALRKLFRSQQAREQDFGESLQDQLRRRIVQLEADEAGERRVALIIAAALLICGKAISIAAYRINDVPYSDIAWSPLRIILVFGSLYVISGWMARRERQRNLPRKRQLQALLNELQSE